MKTFTFPDTRPARGDESLVVLAGLPFIWALWPKLIWLLR
jgi:hypothetical protein